MHRDPRSVLIGAGAGYANDRIDSAVRLLDRVPLDYLVFEGLAERTIALSQLDRLKGSASGYNRRLERRMRAVLPLAQGRGTRIITNMGAANPIAAARQTRAIAEDLALDACSVAVLTGDDVTDLVLSMDCPVLENGQPLASLHKRIVSANAYLGAAGVLAALRTGASVVITGRVADPSLFVAALCHGLGWRLDDLEKMGTATLVGHLLECGAQLTGGYYADPGLKDVPNLQFLGLPFARVTDDGTVSLRKCPDTGGLLTPATCTEQLLYEVHDPGRYITPDCVADFSEVIFHQDGPDQVYAHGARAQPRTDTLKVSVAYRNGFTGEAHVSYGGTNAAARAKLAARILQERFASLGIRPRRTRVDLIGIDSLFGEAAVARTVPLEVRLRVAVETETLDMAEDAVAEVESLYINGPYGGAGADFAIVKEQISVASILIDRSRVPFDVAIVNGRSEKRFS